MSRLNSQCAFALLMVATAAVAQDSRIPSPNTSAPVMTSAESHPLILQESDGEKLVHTSGPLRGLPFIIKVDESNGGAQDFFVFTEVLTPGQAIPFHKHHNAEEILFLEESGATIMVGDKWAVAGARSMVFIPRDTWISAINKGKGNIHVISVFSRQGFERYMRAIGAKPGTPLSPVSPEQLEQLRAMGHATYWDTSKGPYPPGVAHP